MWKHQNVDRARSQTELLMKEALHIRSETPSDILNKDGVLDIHGCWVETIKTLKQKRDRICTGYLHKQPLAMQI